MKSVYRKINEKRMVKMYDSIWYYPKNNYRKYVRSGLQMSEKGYDDLKDLFASDFKFLSVGEDLDDALNNFPKSFLKKFKGSKLTNQLTELSDKGLPAYAYKGQFMRSYCDESGLLDEKLIEEAYSNYQYPGGLENAIKEVNKIDKNLDLVENDELLKIYKHAEKVYVSELEKTINIVILDKIHGIELKYHPLRYDLSNLNPDYYPREVDISKVIGLMKQIEERTNCPVELNVESFLLWLAISLKGIDCANYLFLAGRLVPGGEMWHYESELRFKKSNLFEKYKGYEINVYKVVSDPIADGRTVVRITQEFCVGYDFEKNEFFKALKSGEIDLSKDIKKEIWACQNKKKTKKKGD